MHAQLREPITYLLPLSFNQNSTKNPNFKSIKISNTSRENGSIPISPLQINQKTHLDILDKPVNSTNYASILESSKCPNSGKQVHAHTLKTGFHDEFTVTKLLQMYTRCGCFDDACMMFDKMLERNLYAWKAILELLLDHERYGEAFSLFEELLAEEDIIKLDFFVFPLVFKICSGLNDVGLGRQFHGFVVKCSFVSNIYVCNALIDMYGKCGSLDDGKKVFETMLETDRVSWNSVVTACACNGMVYEALEYMERMESLFGGSEIAGPNLVSWSAVIGGFAQNGYDAETIGLFFQMLERRVVPAARTLASVLPAIARFRSRKLGKEFHGYVTRNGFMLNRFVVNGLIDVYRKCADMESAFELFLKFSVKNVVSCNTMIVGFCENGDVSQARKLFDRRKVFGIENNLITWNSMISGFVHNFLYDDAISMFNDLLLENEVEPDSFTLGSILTVCADTSSLKQGKEIHAYATVRGLQCNTFIGGALVEMYCKCRELIAAQMAFDSVTERDIATWNALISGYTRCNRVEDSKIVLLKMKEDGFEPNVYTWNGIIAGYMENGSCNAAMMSLTEMHSFDLRPDIYTVGIILPACSRLATIERGKQVHGYSIRHGYDTDVYIGAAVVDMYAKCGSIKHAWVSYRRILNPNLVSHNAMLTAYAMHGYSDEGINFFRNLIISSSFIPDHVTFLSVLSLCVHDGLITKGYEFFDLMKRYDVKPNLKHYTCMVDLLSRAGRLSEAYEVIKYAPMECDSVIWGALLGGCLVHADVKLGEIAAEKLIELEPNNAGNYVLLSNLYAYAGMWSDLEKTRQRMKDRGIQKSPGCSWIEDREEVHVFIAGDKSHQRTEVLYATLDSMTLHMKTLSKIVL